jgi:hypothetical protein
MKRKKERKEEKKKRKKTSSIQRKPRCLVARARG